MNRNGRTDLETPIPGIIVDYDAQALADALIARGHSVGIIAQESGLSIIQVLRQPLPARGRHGAHDGKGHKSRNRHQAHRTLLVGGADQRRDGTVGGR